MLSSVTYSTWKQYDSALRRWWNFQKDRDRNPFHVTVPSILEFLTHWYSRGASHGTLNSARSAIAFLAPPGLAEDYRIRRLFKGISNLRPSAPRYDETWDPAIVLNYIRSLGANASLDLPTLTAKLATLLALVTAHRLQTLSLIQVENIEETCEGIHIKIPLRTKTSKRGTLQPILYLPFFQQEQLICAASTLQHYLHVTKLLRPNVTDRLFLTVKKPLHQASSQTLSRWIRTMLTASGLDSSKFTAYSTRHASVSAASRKGISLDVIRSTAGWSKTSETFARFYNRPLALHSQDALAQAVLSSCLQ